MPKLARWVAAAGLMICFAAVTGCETPGQQNVVHKLKTEAQRLDEQSYKSTAMMTVQMDNGSQTYYIETLFQSPDVYRISLGDANKNINQIIVRNKSGMFIVSPSLQKVFRFNGNWVQNQGHIYLYDQILQQVASADNLKISKSGGNYSFTMPVTPANDVISKELVEIDARTLAPRTVILYDKQDHAVVTISFTSYQKGVKLEDASFDPHKLTQGATKSTMTSTGASIGYITPTEMFGDQLSILQPETNDATLLRYTGAYPFTLTESRADSGTSGLVDTGVVDLYGIPAMYTGDTAHQLTWLNNGVQFTLASRSLSLDQMKSVAISTLGQVGK